MIESITTIRNHHRIKAKLLISLYFTKVKWHFIPFIYTVMEYKRMLPFRKMSLLLVNTRDRWYFYVAIYTVVER